MEITIIDKGIIADDRYTCEDMVNIFLSAITAVVNVTLEKVPTETKTKARSEIFDGLNNSFSRCLEVTFPEYAGRPDLTEQAILKAENEILQAAPNNVVNLPTNKNKKE